MSQPLLPHDLDPVAPVHVEIKLSQKANCPSQITKDIDDKEKIIHGSDVIYSLRASTNSSAT